MKYFDYNYIATMIGDFSRIPVHIYKNNELIFYYSTTYFIKDPISIYQSDILKISDHIGYFLTENFSCYGVVNSNEYKFVIGPTKQVSSSASNLLELAIQLNIPKEEIDEFIIAMQEINHIPFENLMQIMCFLNYILNNEKYSLEDIFIDDSLQKHFAQKTSHHETDHSLPDKLSEQDIIFHSTYDLEENLMNMIRKGDYISLSNLLENSPIFKIDVMESNHLRFLKNTFIAIATLASHAAIQGGMTPDDAYTLIDNYILMCELLNDCNRIDNLGRLMIIDFAKRVNQLYKGTQATRLILDVSNYINRHMSEQITVEAMSKELFMSRSYLSKRFKAESNVTLTDFILTKKTAEAKHLLRYTKQSLTAISLHLGFSSPGHFSRVFRKYASVSPKEYRKKYTKEYVQHKGGNTVN